MLNEIINLVTSRFDTKREDVLATLRQLPGTATENEKIATIVAPTTLTDQDLTDLDYPKAVIDAVRRQRTKLATAAAAPAAPAATPTPVKAPAKS